MGIILANTRVSADTGFDQLIALAPPYAVGLDDDTIDVTFTSATKAAFVVEGSPGQTGTVTYSKLATNAPPALTGHTITAIPTVKAKKQATSVITFTNQYLTVKSSKVSAGTYTYAPYTPTMALVQANFTSGDGAGETAYVFLDFVSTVAGSYVLAEPDTASPGGWRYEPGKFTFSTTK